MPPKTKYTKSQIIDAAVEIVRKKGIEALTARELGTCLGISSRPIFTAFESMNGLRAEILDKARCIFRSHITDNSGYSPAFKHYSMQVILFAQNEPKLFQLLFMREECNHSSFTDVLGSVIGGSDHILYQIKSDYGLNDEQAVRLFNHLWIYVYGICVLCAENVCRFSNEQLSNMISECFAGMLSVINSEHQQAFTAHSATTRI